MTTEVLFEVWEHKIPVVAEGVAHAAGILYGHHWRPWPPHGTVTVCEACGTVRRADGKNKPCRGPHGIRPFKGR